MADELSDVAHDKKDPSQRAVDSLVEAGLSEADAKYVLERTLRDYQSGKEPLADCSPADAAMIRGIVEKHSGTRDYKSPDSEQ